MKTINLFRVCFFIAFPTFLLAQETQTGIVRVTFPLNRTVIQQNTANSATVSISGQYYGDDYYNHTCQYRFVSLSPTSGIATDDPSWTTISTTSISDGKIKMFFQNETKSVGWYQLEIRLRKKRSFWSFCFNNDPNSNCWNTMASQKVKVGVGDVYVIYGQSNASGFNDNSSDNNLVGQTTDAGYTQRDAVSSISRDNLAFPEFKIAGFPIDGVGFKNLNLTNKIYPNGPVSWCWAPLGDKLVNTFQTPTMFINAGVPNRSIELLSDLNFWEYKRFRNTLQLYAHILGTRGVLWLQGESNAVQQQATRSSQIDFLDYTEKMNSLIIQSRKDLGSGNSTNDALTWNVSKVSYYTFPEDPFTQLPGRFCVYNSNPNGGCQAQIPHECTSAYIDPSYNCSLTTAQNYAVNPPFPDNPLPNVRTGIATDDLDASTRGQHQRIHFTGATHSVVAEKWLQSGINTGNPMSGKNLQPITVTKEINPYNGQDSYKLVAPSGYDEYFWVENGNGIYTAGFINFSRSQEKYVPLTNNGLKIFTCYLGKSTDQPSGIGDGLDGWNLKFEMTQPFIVPGYKDFSTLSLSLSTYLYQVGQSAYDNSFNVISENVIWEADENDAWITIGPDDNIGGGDGTTSLIVHLDENTDPNLRVGNIYVRNSDGSILRTLRIEQEGTATPCGNNLSLSSPSDDYNSSATKRAIISIDATNKVNSGANVEYKAGNFILLQAGFKVENGAIFKATIPNDPCNE